MSFFAFRTREPANLIFQAPLVNSTALIVGLGSPTFTRSGSKWYLSAGTGLITEATDGNAAFEGAGISMEGTSTNECLRSAELDVGGAGQWVATNTTVTADDAVAPNGVTEAERVNITSAVGHNQQFIIWPGGNASKTITVSCYLQDQSGSSELIRLKSTQSGIIDNFNQVTATDAWQKFSLVVTNTSDVADGTQIVGLAEDTSDNLSDVNAWGFNAEENPFQSSQIVTTSAAVIRNKDQLTYQSSGNINASSGTIKFVADVANIAQRMTFVDTRDSGGLNGVLIFMDTSGQTNFEVYDGSGLVVTLTDTANPFVINTPKSIEARWATLDYELKTDDVSRDTDTLETNVPASHDIIRLGEDKDNASELWGHLSNVLIFQV
jgi:hypothetical protein